ncbi:MAG: 50S ribosomal protein L6 [Candidatus Omnitrophica bacterium]|nr:50S ribosomal protein L6 [Candidatus Omnitrophota bacterium]
MSRIGKKAIAVPKEVKVEVKDGKVFVEGPKGKLSRALSDRIKIEIKDAQILVNRVADTKIDRSLHGLSRALILNMVKGVSEGYLKELEIIGVGFKAAVQIPEGIKIETPKPTQIIISSIDKELIGKVSSEIRSIYPPEPYKGKGIRFQGEYVKKKIGKAQATGGGK